MASVFSHTVLTSLTCPALWTLESSDSLSKTVVYCVSTRNSILFKLDKVVPPLMLTIDTILQIHTAMHKGAHLLTLSKAKSWESFDFSSRIVFRRLKLAYTGIWPRCQVQVTFIFVFFFYMESISIS